MKLRAAAVPAVVMLLVAPAVAQADVHLRGTAYEFNNTTVRLGGAEIRVAENDKLRATTRPDGTYDLVVPSRARVTPYIVKPGYHTIHLQTFRTAGKDLARVNFQTPTDDVYKALASLLSVPLTPAGELQDCAIVSTFSTRKVRNLSFEAFRKFGAHGVAGATAGSTPKLPPATYFNDKVIPDPKQKRSSIDGGVVWTEVPAGTYTIRASHKSKRFARFTATCEPGRVVNANPPWGLYELPRKAKAKASVATAAAKKKTLRILVSNDDGVKGPGLDAPPR